MDYFQFQVARVWYRLYWAIMLSYSILSCLLYIVDKVLPSMHRYGMALGLSPATIIIGSFTLIYLSSAYWFIARRSLPFAALIGSMLFSVGILNGLTQTDPRSGAYVYVAVWILSTFMMGIYGLPILMGYVVMTLLYAALQSSFEPLRVSTPALFFTGMSSVVALAAHFFWRTRFLSLETQRVNQLSGMLKNNQQQSAILIESIADGIIVTNTEGRITLINPAAAVMTGWSVDEATGVDVKLVAKINKEDGSDIQDDDNPFTVVLKQQQQLSQTLQITSRDEKKITISLVASPVITAGSTDPVGVVAVIRDISDARAAEKQRADFISTASHEMRTPVAAIEGYLSLALNDKVSTIDNRARSYLDKAHASTTHLGRLFQDLLTSSKAEDGRLNNHPLVVEMGTYLQQLTDDLKFAAEKKGLLADFIIGGTDGMIDATARDISSQHVVKPLYYTFVDPERLREVITNLFDNACKYTDSGKISIGLTGNNDVVQLYVRDTGAGIPADDIPHLFQKFYRVDSSATRTIGGTGLGLFICRKIIELYHGRIWVESEVGKGSTFFMNLPRLTTQKANELQAAENSPKVAPVTSATLPEKA